jgi:hypothetical protein
MSTPITEQQVADWFRDRMAELNEATQGGVSSLQLYVTPRYVEWVMFRRGEPGKLSAAGNGQTTSDALRSMIANANTRPIAVEDEG